MGLIIWVIMIHKLKVLSLVIVFKIIKLILILYPKLTKEKVVNYLLMKMVSKRLSKNIN